MQYERAVAGSVQQVLQNTPPKPENSISIYPNPSNGNCSVAFGLVAGGFAQVDLYDMTGRFIRRVWSGELEKSVTFNANLDVSALADGMYIVRMVSGKISKSTKLLLRH